MGSFFRRVSSTFFVHLFNNNNNWTMGVQNILETSEPRPKQKEKPTSRISKLYCLGVLHLVFFRHWDFFLKIFGLHQRVPLHLFRYFATEWMLKIPKGPPLVYIFLHCDTSKISIFFKLFILKSPKGPPSFFFHILQQTGVSKSPKALLQF